jgi:hypothetical protein
MSGQVLGLSGGLSPVSIAFLIHSSVYSDGQLKMFATHVAQLSGLGTRPEYYMNKLRSFAMTLSPHSVIS